MDSCLACNFATKEDGTPLTQCRDCEELLGSADFYHKSATLTLLQPCKKCFDIKSTNYQRKKRNENDAHFRLKQRAACIKRECKTRKGGSITVSKELGNILCGLWDKQGGRCFYTGNEMFLGADNFKVNNRQHCTIDRMRPTEGYEDGNLVLCCNYFNRAKQDMEWDEFVAFCQEVVNLKDTIKIT